jgi:hypothetical protein
MVCPEQPALASRPGLTLLGFLSPTAQSNGVHVLDLRPGHRVTTEVGIQLSVNRSQTVDYGATHRFSQPLSDDFLLLPPDHFQAGSTHGVMSFRGLIPSSRPFGSSPQAYPLDVFPFGCAALVLGQDASRHVCQP